MFSGCSSLTTAPALPATSLAKTCYKYMFYGCKSLTQAPELPGTELKEGCYHNMFYGCSSLTTAPKLPATDLALNCYSNMFNGCNKLIGGYEYETRFTTGAVTSAMAQISLSEEHKGYFTYNNMGTKYYINYELRMS